MKLRMISLALGIMALTACKKEDPIMETPMTTENNEVLYSGNFMSSSRYETSGTVELQEDNTMKRLVFSNFKTDNGPDLRVYLSKDNSDNDFIDLGKLKGTEGAFFYVIEQEINFSEYSHVLIWCEDFSVLFGYTALK